MPLITIVIILIIVGVLLWLANTYIPMDQKIRLYLQFVLTLMLPMAAARQYRGVGSG